MIIKELRGKLTMAGPGSWAFDAEAVVDDNGKTVYVHANWYDDFKHYTVSTQSRFDFLAGNTDDAPDGTVLEEYKSLRGAAKSKYIAAIKAANAVMNSLGYEE